MSEKITTKRARVFLEAYGTGVLRDINTVDAATYAFSETTIEKESTNEVRGITASETIKTDGTLKLTLGSTEWANFVAVTRSKESTQGAVSDGAFTFPAMEKGQSFKLPHSNITAIAAPGLTEGADYQVFKASGIVVAMADVTAAVAGGTYSAGLAKRAGITAGSTAHYTVHITDELNGEYTQLYKFKPNLPANVDLIKPNEFGTYEIEGKLLLDTTKPVSGDLGQFGYKTEAQ